MSKLFTPITFRSVTIPNSTAFCRNTTVGARSVIIVRIVSPQMSNS